MAFGAHRTVDLPGEPGSPYDSPLVAIESAEGPFLVSWQPDVPSAAFVRKPSEALDVAVLEPGGALPLLGLRPWSASWPDRYSLLCLQRPWRDSFEVFFFSWDAARGFSFASSGAFWNREDGRLRRLGQARSRLTLVSCAQLPPEASCLGCVFGAVFRLEKQGGHDAEAKELQAWLSS
jgi:hypothetical protein